MIDITKFSNLNEITREEFDILVKGEKYEVLTHQNLLKFTEDFKEELEKSEETLPVSETISLLKAEIGDFNQIKVRENNLSLSTYYIRDIEKGKKANVGEVREWNGKKYKKQSNGKWVEVSEHGMTKKEHEEKHSIHNENLKTYSKSGGSNKQELHKEEAKKHQDAASKLSDKEHSDEEVIGKEGSEKKEEIKDFKDVLKDSKTPSQFWNKMPSMTKQKFLKETGVLDNTAHMYTVVGRMEGRVNVGMAILNVSTGDGSGEGLSWGDLHKSTKRDITNYFEKNK